MKAVYDKALGADAGLSRPVYDAPHAPRPWGWKVAAYLWTKSVAAGALAVAALGFGAGAPGAAFLGGVAAPALALLFLLATAALLVWDLKRPDRFLYIVLKPNRRSWLVWGAWILMAYGGVGALWLLSGLAGHDGLLRALGLPTLALAAGTAGYSAFLFGQAEGRDFWQSPLLLPQLLVGAVVAGAASLLLVGVLAAVDPEALWELGALLAVALMVHAVILAAELFGAHTNLDVARAARLVTRGPWRGRFWWGVVLGGTVLPILLIWPGPGPAALGALLALGGLWLYEDLWIRAGQSIPLS